MLQTGREICAQKQYLVYRIIVCLLLVSVCICLVIFSCEYRSMATALGDTADTVWKTVSILQDTVGTEYDCLEKPFDFYGKTICAFGDSITAGVTSPEYAVTQNSYINLFAKQYNMQLTNRAVSGATLCAEKDTSISRMLEKETGSYDIILIAGGTNDYGKGKPLGAYFDTNVETVYGALRYMCDILKEKHAQSTVIFITPVNWTKLSQKNTANLDSYSKAIYEIATEYGFNVVDGSLLGLPSSPGEWSNEMITNEDGCHPTEKGHWLYYMGLCRKLS